MHEFSMQGYCQIILTILCAAVITECTVEIIVDSKLFLPLRKYIANKAVPEDMSSQTRLPYMWWFLHGITSCGYCMSVWVGCFYAAFLQAPIVENIYINFFINGLIIHRLSNLAHVLYMRVYRGEVKYTHNTIKLEEQEDGL